MHAHTRITIDTGADPLVLQHVNCFVQELDKVELTFSVAAMRAMGRSTMAFLKQAATISSEYELAHLHTDGVQQPALRLAIGDDDMEKTDEGKDERKKGAYGGGIGRIPQTCAPDQEKLGLLCYTKCPAGYTRRGLDFHSNCPDGFRDDRLFCRLAEYGRGVGYPWKFGDELNDNGMFRRYEGDNGKGGCEKWGLLVYPKCKPGYSSFGCCICRPARPDCAAVGLGGRLDLSCSKKIQLGKVNALSCGADQVYDAGQEMQ